MTATYLYIKTINVLYCRLQHLRPRGMGLDGIHFSSGGV